MSLKLQSTVAIGAILFLTGCAETSALGSAINQTVNAVVTGATSTVQTPSSQPKQMTTGDMYHLFGWMEDGCEGDRANYKYIRSNYSQFIDSFMQTIDVTPSDPRGSYVKYVVKPKNQWPASYHNKIKDIVVSTPDGFDITYTVIFKDMVKYRGQPLDTFSFNFTSGTEGSQQVLNFNNRANVAAIFSNFRTRQYEPHWGEPGKVYTNGASYNPNNKTVICESD